MTDLEIQAKAALARDTLKAKGWWATNREEAIALVCSSGAVGMLVGIFAGYILRGPHL